MERHDHEEREEREETQGHGERAREHVEGAAQKTTGAWIEGQATLFNQVDNVARRWLDRRREALDATRQSLDEMKHCGDMRDILRIQQDWVMGALRRVMADFSELTKATLEVSQGTVSRVGQTTRAIGEDMGRACEEAMNAGRAQMEHGARAMERAAE